MTSLPFVTKCLATLLTHYGSQRWLCNRLTSFWLETVLGEERPVDVKAVDVEVIVVAGRKKFRALAVVLVVVIADSLSTKIRGCTGTRFTCFLEVHVTLWSGRTSFFSSFSTNLATNFLSATMNGRTKLLYLNQLFYTHITLLITDMPKSNPTSPPALVRRVDWYPHCPKIPSTSRDMCEKQRQMVTKEQIDDDSRYGAINRHQQH